LNDLKPDGCHQLGLYKTSLYSSGNDPHDIPCCKAFIPFKVKKETTNETFLSSLTKRGDHRFKVKATLLHYILGKT
jgi:hypothetical protein